MTLKDEPRSEKPSERLDRDVSDETRTETEGATLDAPIVHGTFSPGQVLGDRYRVMEMLGRGGIGEVWRAFDLKLRVDVALKALNERFSRSERRLEILRQEVRAARQVVSPNVCRIFDLVEIDGRELVSMEYVDGATLLALLQERGPLELKEAQDIASQFLAGLEAIHKEKLVHRDIKPENIMVTRAGRVVVMDFGLARREDDGGWSVSGTPAYMSPEHAAGQTLDPRTDVYSAGVVLAEMVSPEGIRSLKSRRNVWEGVRSEPVKLPDSPWAPVLKQAVAKDREQRFNSAHTLTRALEDVTLRVEGADDLNPYPGLSSFTEEDAEYFFGREAEVEQMWRKLEGPPRMLALVGPSGAGKTSFVSAGLIPSTTTEWATVVCTPGTNPELALSRSLAGGVVGDSEAVDLLLRFEEPDVAVEVASRWRRNATHALLIVDQFEELFTQNSPEDQQRFAELLSRLVLEADFHVLLSMRDDFFFFCHQHEALKPVVTDLTLLGPPTGAALRRALVQPATKCGYRFEADSLVEEMLAEVEGERGALPLLAFAASRLWEMRDRKDGLLTRKAYQDIGGVGGALARHAEATVDRIGLDRLPIVRELFRNIVTAEGTRSVRLADDLLSVFEDSDRESASKALTEMVNSRLLTSYDVGPDEGQPQHQVEVIHESLLDAWPRLVRWRTQDADGAQLRDQLRQAAQTWIDREKAEDLLWTGSVYREFRVWRESYPGGLSEVEEQFAAAMTARAKRRRRLRQTTVGAAFILLVGVAAVFSLLWRQAAVAQERTLRESRRAEASRFLTLARSQERRTPKLAFATTSLELADTMDARQLAITALWDGPPASFIDDDREAWGLAFSSDGHQLVVTHGDGSASLWAADSTTSRHLLGPGMHAHTVRYANDGSSILISDFAGVVRALSIPDGEELQTLQLEGTTSLFPEATGQRYITESILPDLTASVWRRWVLGEWAPALLGEMTYQPRAQWLREGACAVDPSGKWIVASTQPQELTVFQVNGRMRRRSVPGGRHADLINRIEFSPDGSRLATCDRSGVLKVWSFEAGRMSLLQELRSSIKNFVLRFDSQGERIAVSGGLRTVFLWDLSLPAQADPVVFSNTNQMNQAAFHPEGSWLATSRLSERGVQLWPLNSPTHRVLRGHDRTVVRLAFLPNDGRLLSASMDGTVRIWPLSSPLSDEMRVAFRAPQAIDDEVSFVDVAGNGRFFVVSSYVFPEIFVVPIDGGPPRILPIGEPARSAQYYWGGVAIDQEGRRVAACGGPSGFDGEGIIRIWDLRSDTVRTLDAKIPPGTYKMYSCSVQFDAAGDLLATSSIGLQRWDLNAETFSNLRDGPIRIVALDELRKTILLAWGGRLHRRLMEDGEEFHYSAHGSAVYSAAMDPSGRILVTGDHNGVVRVGHADGSEPHLLLGHEGAVPAVAISPDGRWIASGGADNTIRLWPMPDLDRTPIHLLPRDELLATLRSLTNLRALPDSAEANGYRLEVEPFRGWSETPIW